MVPPPSRRIPRVLRYSGYPPPHNGFAYRAFTVSGRPFQASSAVIVPVPAGPYPGGPWTTGLGSFPFARRYLGNRCFFLFLRLLRCFSSPGSPRHTMYSCDGDMLPHAGFPHSGTHGSRPAYGSPWLFAVRCALLRLLVPRHSPCALISLIF